MFSFIKDLSIDVMENESIRKEDFNDDSMVTWEEETYRSFFKACNVKQKVEVFDAIKSMKALVISFTDEKGLHRVFMPADKAKEDFVS